MLSAQRAVVDGDQAAQLVPRGPAGAVHPPPRRPARGLRPGRAAHRRQRGGQERVGPRPDHPRPQPGRRRSGHRQALPERRADRLLRGAAAPPHGAARHRHRQRPGPLRARRGARAQVDRPGDPAGELAAGRGLRPPRASTRASTPSSTPRSPTSACRWRWAATSRSWSRSPPATTCSRCRATTRRASSRASSSASWSAAAGRQQGCRRTAAGPVEAEAVPPMSAELAIITGLSGSGKSHRRQGLRGPRLLHRRQPATAAAAGLPRAARSSWFPAIRASRSSPTFAPPASPRSSRSSSATSTARQIEVDPALPRGLRRGRWCAASRRPGGRIRWRRSGR